jgi:putative flippase GtrA
MTAKAPAKNKQRLWTLVRSYLVGIPATASDLGLLWLLVGGLGLSKELANVPSLLAGVLVQFFGNKFFAFRDRSPNLLRQGVLFALIEVGTLFLNWLAYHLLVTYTDVHYLLARMIGTAGVYLAFSFPLWGLIFRPTPPPEAVQPAEASL